MAKNKVTFNGQTLIDLSTDTVASAADIVSGKVGHLRDGSVVTGTGGGGGKNVQTYIGRAETNQTAYTATAVSVKVNKAGTYKCSWSMDRNTTSGTNGSQLYVNGTAKGSAHTTWTHNGESCTETLTLALNDTVVVRARARNTSYYCGVSNLIIEEQ